MATTSHFGVGFWRRNDRCGLSTLVANSKLDLDERNLEVADLS